MGFCANPGEVISSCVASTSPTALGNPLVYLPCHVNLRFIKGKVSSPLSVCLVVQVFIKTVR